MLKYKVNVFEALYMSSVIKACFLKLGIVAKAALQAHFFKKLPFGDLQLL